MGGVKPLLFLPLYNNNVTILSVNSYLTPTIMKTIKLSIMALLLISFMACQKSSDLSTNVTNEQAADIAAGSISFSSNGVGNISDDGSSDASAYVTAKAACGSTKVDSISRSNVAGSAYVYNYKLKYTYTVNCNSSNIPDNLSAAMNYSGSFSGPNISSTNSGSATFTLAGLTPTATTYVINGDYKRSGTFKSKIDTTNNGTASVDIVITNLTLTKPARVIKSGTAIVTITGNVPKKGNFNFIGNVVFNGDGTATLTIGTTSYSVNLITGVRTKI